MRVTSPVPPRSGKSRRAGSTRHSNYLSNFEKEEEEQRTELVGCGGKAEHACTLLLFSLLLPASEDASHTVHFITSACSTNLLSGQAGYEATEVQQISKLRASLALPKKSSRVQGNYCWLKEVLL